MKTIILTLAILLGLFNTAAAKSLSLEEIIDGSCRVTSQLGLTQTSPYGGLSFGSGTVIREDDSKFYVLTNGHVVQGAQKVFLEFFSEGYKSYALPATVEKYWYNQNTSVDLSVLSVAKTYFGERKPRVVSVAPKEVGFGPNDLIRGAGCPAGRWSQAWQARLVKKNSNTLTFNMVPFGGQSGSGILVDYKADDGETYTVLAGVVTWDVGADHGAGISLARIYEIFSGAAQSDALEVNIVPVQHKAEEAIDTLCQCGRPKSEHTAKVGSDGKYIKTTDGSIKYFCPRCPTHNWTYQQHIQRGFIDEEFCGPHGCFPSKPPKPPVLRPAEPKVPVTPGPGGAWEMASPSEDYKAKLEALNKEKAKVETELLDLKKQVVDLMSEKTVSDSMLAEKSGKVEELLGKIEEVTGSKDGLSSQLQDITKTLEQEISAKDKLSADLAVAKGDQHWLKDVIGPQANKVENTSFTLLGGLGAMGLLKLLGPMFAKMAAGKVIGGVINHGQPQPPVIYNQPLPQSSPPVGSQPYVYHQHKHEGDVKHVHVGSQQAAQQKGPEYVMEKKDVPGPIPSTSSDLNPGWLPYGTEKKS